MKVSSDDSTRGSGRLDYLTNGELRGEIAYAVGADPTRYGPGSSLGLTKDEVLKVCERLRPPHSEVTLHECKLEPLYERACRWAGGEYQPNAGKAWKINRKNLKRIHRAVGAADPRTVVAHE